MFHPTCELIVFRHLPQMTPNSAKILISFLYLGEPSVQSKSLLWICINLWIISLPSNYSHYTRVVPHYESELADDPSWPSDFLLCLHYEQNIPWEKEPDLDQWPRDIDTGCMHNQLKTKENNFLGIRENENLCSWVMSHLMWLLDLFLFVTRFQ